jgi:uncharacterized protein (DUF849 family)
MANRKVIISCAVTGSIPTPPLSLAAEEGAGRVAS